jgi:hypothetical protein
MCTEQQDLCMRRFCAIDRASFDGGGVQTCSPTTRLASLALWVGRSTSSLANRRLALPCFAWPTALPCLPLQLDLAGLPYSSSQLAYSLTACTALPHPCLLVRVALHACSRCCCCLPGSAPLALIPGLPSSLLPGLSSWAALPHLVMCLPPPASVVECWWGTRGYRGEWAAPTASEGALGLLYWATLGRPEVVPSRSRVGESHRAAMMRSLRAAGVACTPLSDTRCPRSAIIASAGRGGASAGRGTKKPTYYPSSPAAP